MLLKTGLLLITFSLYISNSFAQLNFERYTIESDMNQASSVFIADLNGDVLPEIIGVGSDGYLKWYENSTENDFVAHTTEFFFSGTQEECIYAIDMDNDGDVDILGAERNADNIVWLENDGQGTFQRHVIDNTLDAPWSVYAADMDNDGDMDVLCAANFSADISWFENNGNQVFSKHLVTPFIYANSVFAVDMDGDNDLDIIGAASNPTDEGGIVWWENINNDFSIAHIVDSSIRAGSVYAADINNDSQMDIIGSSLSEDKIVVWKNEGDQNFAAYTIAEDYDGAESPFVIDLDGDNDLDILAVGYWQEHLDWWENDGNGNYTKQNIAADYQGAREIHAADIDGDGDIDIATANLLNDEISIWLNQGPTSNRSPNENDKLSIYPNPTTNNLTIAIEDLPIQSIEIRNLIGELVFLTKEGDNALDVSKYVSGTYFITVRSEGNAYVKKVIIQ